jgi:hypothetical protein
VRTRSSRWILCTGGWAEVGVWVQQEEKEECDKAADVDVEAEAKVEVKVERRQKARRRGAHGAGR